MRIIFLLITGLWLGPARSLASCFGATFDTIGNGFEYRANLNQPEGCRDSVTRATRLFIAGACSIRHNNNFDGHPPACPPGDSNILDTSSATCEAVFSQAHPWDIKDPIGNGTFDIGSICNNGVNSVLFVQTNCSLLSASSVVLQQRVLSGDLCWDGRMLSRGQLAGIVIGAAVGLMLLLAIPVAIYAFLKRRRDMRAAWQEANKGHNLSSMCQYSKYSQQSPGIGAQQCLNSNDGDLEDIFDPIFDDELQEGGHLHGKETMHRLV